MKKPVKKNLKSSAASQNINGYMHDLGYNECHKEYEKFLPSEESIHTIVRHAYSHWTEPEENIEDIATAIYKRIGGGAKETNIDDVRFGGAR